MYFALRSLNVSFLALILKKGGLEYLQAFRPIAK